MRNVVILAVLALAASPATSQDPRPAPELRWERVAGRSVALRTGETELWRFHLDGSAPHVFFHPLALPGTAPLTVDSPADHVWHHGLWFSWKFIDGVNYWEHASGSDRPAGRTLSAVRGVDLAEDGRATFRLRVDYAPGADADPVLTEDRTIAVAAPAADGSYAIDWTGRFTARAERVVLDRTPLPGEPRGQVFGGYAGLSLRLTNLAHRAAVTTEGPQEFNGQERLRTRSNAFDYSGELDGRPVGIAVLSHPDNPNAPSPWYAIRSAAMTFFSPAVLCYGPMELARGERITLRYRVIVHPGRFDADQLGAALRRFAEETAAAERHDEGAGRKGRAP